MSFSLSSVQVVEVFFNIIFVWAQGISNGGLQNKYILIAGT
jgi:hypothetical protein